MSNRTHYLQVLKDMILYGAVGASAQFSNLLLLPLLVRLFSAKEYGAIDLVTVSGALTTLLMTLGLPSGVIRFFHEKGVPGRRRMVSSLLVFAVAVSTGLCLLLIGVTPFLIEHTVQNPRYVHYFRLGWIASAVTAPCFVLGAVLRSERRILQYGIVNLATFASQIAFSVVLVTYFRLGIDGVFWGSIFSGILGLALAVIYTRSYLKGPCSWAACREVLSYSLPLVPAHVALWINQRGTRYIIVLYMTLSEVGLYGVGVLLSGVIAFIATSFQNSWNSYVMTLLEHESFLEINRRILQFYMGGMIVLGLGFLAVLKEVCLFGLGPQYLEALPLMPWLIAGAILQGSGNITNIGVTVTNRTGVNNLASWTGVVVNLALSLLFVPSVGLAGVAVSYFISRLVYTYIFIVATHRLHAMRFQLLPQAVLLTAYMVLSQGIVWLAVHEEGFVLRYLAAAAGCALIVRYMNILGPLYASFKSRIRIKWPVKAG